MMYKAQRHLERKKSILTHWTADSSTEAVQLGDTGCWVLEDHKAVRVWCFVRELAVPEPHAADAPRLTRELWDSLKFLQLPPVSLGWKAEGAAEKLAAAVALECKMDDAQLRSVCRSAGAAT